MIIIKEKFVLSDYLSSPKTTDELYECCKDENSDWNKEQLELYLNLNKKIKREKEKWKIGEISKEEKLLNLIRNKLDNKKVIKLDVLINELPYGLVFSQDDIISLVKREDDLECPNPKVITKK